MTGSPRPRRFRLGPLLAAGLLLALAAIAFLWFRPAPVTVDPGIVDRGPVVMTVGGRAIARVRDSYDVTAPMAGRLLRIDVEVGDRVEAGKTVVARLRPADPGFLDSRSRRALEARAAEARARIAAADAHARRAMAEARVARQDHDRVAKLVRDGWMAQAAMDRSRATRDEAEAALAAARAEAGAARQALAEVEASLAGPLARNGAEIPVTAPVSGRVLELFHKSETVVPAGERLLAIGDPGRDLELVADLLSTDAVKVREGAAVSIDQWGGARPLAGRVRLVEPYGFLKISALGIEEQRVNVVIDFVGDKAGWSRLGPGYRAEVRIVTEEAADVVRVPAPALVRSAGAAAGDAGGWAVHVVRDCRAELVPVTTGLMNERHAEIRSGLEPGDMVVLFPPESLKDGRRVRSSGENGDERCR